MYKNLSLAPGRDRRSALIRYTCLAATCLATAWSLPAAAAAPAAAPVAAAAE